MDFIKGIQNSHFLFTEIKIKMIFSDVTVKISVNTGNVSFASRYLSILLLSVVPDNFSRRKLLA